MRRCRFVVVLLCLLTAGKVFALDLCLPTANDAVLRPGYDAEFFQATVEGTTESGMFGCEKIEQGEVIALMCICQNKSPDEILRTYHFINGKLSMRADAMLAGFQARGGKIEWKKHDREAAVAIFTPKDGAPIEISYTIEDAQKALEGMPQDAQNIVKGVMQQLDAANKQIQALELNLKHGIAKTEVLANAKVHDTQVNAATKVHDTQTRSGDASADSREAA